MSKQLPFSKDIKDYLVKRESGKYTYIINGETIVIENVGRSFMIETFHTLKTGELYLVDSYGYKGLTLKKCISIISLSI